MVEEIELLFDRLCRQKYCKNKLNIIYNNWYNVPFL